MPLLDPAGETLRLSAHYRRLTDDELVGLAWQASELTDGAQQALAQEIANRGLKIPPNKSAAPPRPQPPDPADDAKSPYAEDRELIALCTVWSSADALKVQGLLDAAAIPFYIGPEKATDVEAVTSNFADGLTVQIMKVGFSWAQQALQQYFPADEPPAEKFGQRDNLAIRCPRCRSTEVVFEDLDRAPENSKLSPKFQWTCDSCGHKWQDDGLVTKE